MKLLADFKQSLIWHVVTGKYEVTDKGELRKRKESELKDSGVEWIGKIPKGWGTRRIKELGTVKRGASPRPIDDPKYFSESGEFYWTRISDVTNSSKFIVTSEQKLSDLGASLSVKLPSGTLIMSMAASIGKVCITKGNFCIHDGFVAIITNKVEWLYAMLNSPYPYKGLGKLGTQLNLNSKTIENICLPHPIENESPKILAFLSSLDTLIPATDGVLKLINDWYQSTVWHVVTGKYEVTDKGELRKRKDSELKDSGVEWIGKIPKGWETRRIKEVTTIEKGETPVQKFEGEYPYYNGGVKPTGQCQGYNADGSTLLMSNGGANAGALTKTTGKIWVGGDCYKIKTAPLIEIQLLSIQHHKEVYTEGSGIPHANLDKFEKLSVPIPPENESQKILSFLESLSKKVEKLKENL